MPLIARPVADFYAEFMAHLESLGVQVAITRQPVEVDNHIPFDEDRTHAAYDPEYVNRCWRILVGVARVLEQHRTPFIGKSSPVNFWWGSFDLATTRYSGRPAPPRDWPARWMALGAEQEQSLAGFWPGNERLTEPAFVAYTYPEPPGCRAAAVQPDAAFFHPELAEFVLPYEQVRNATDPAATILDFYRSTYEIGAILGGWDRQALERPDPTKIPGAAGRHFRRGGTTHMTTQAEEVSACSHLDQVRDVRARTPDGCEECLQMGSTWVHLRLCLSCGHVGCCDNSPNKHATAHYHQSHDPLIQSFERGEDWGWCYVDELFLEPAPLPEARRA
jgi:hypothetical protein